MLAYHTMSRSTANIAEEAFHQLRISKVSQFLHLRVTVSHCLLLEGLTTYLVRAHRCSPEPVPSRGFQKDELVCSLRRHQQAGYYAGTQLCSTRTQDTNSVSQLPASSKVVGSFGGLLVRRMLVLGLGNLHSSAGVTMTPQVNQAGLAIRTPERHSWLGRRHVERGRRYK